MKTTMVVASSHFRWTAWLFAVLVSATLGSWTLWSACLANSAPLKEAAATSGSTDTIKVFFAPYDAPFIRNDYNDRINSILFSLDESGRFSFLIDPAIQLYKERILSALIPDYKLTANGMALLTENKRWLVDKKGRPTSGYQRYSAARANIAGLLQSGKLDEARTHILEFFSDIQGFRYIDAEQIVRALASGPNQRIYREITDRIVVGGIANNSYVLFPHPQDLDIAENWQPIGLVANDGRQAMVGLGTYVQVFVTQADRVLERLAKPEQGTPFYLPRRLLFVKSLRESTLPEATKAGAIIDVPHEKLDVYRNSTAVSSVIFLLTVEMERCAF